MHVTDDRGQRVKLIPYRYLAITPGMPSPIPMNDRRLMYGERERAKFSKEVLIATSLACAISLAWFFAWRQIAWYLVNTFPLATTFNILATAVGCWLPIVVVSSWILQRAVRQKTSHIVVSHGFCASCGYSLADLIAASDGCTLCPECGSAWRIPAAKDE
jgi:hypothetical protein